ncbi:MAG: M23 family metallopeptidase [Desulfarculus sp.]|nr:MAG: M23 family metallopeptidase [Desulfarculus sp.]
MAKKFTILIFPEEGSGRVKRLSFPRFLVPLALGVLVSALGLAGYWFNRYQDVSCELPVLRAHLNQGQRQQAQIQAFAQRLEELKGQMAQLKDFNRRLRAMANLKAIAPKDDPFGVGGREGAANGPGIRLSTTSGERRLQMLQRDLDRLGAESEAELQVQRHLARFLVERRSILAATPSIWPTRGWVTSGFGRRISPFSGKPSFHAGIDISTRVGTPIKAPADGVVTFAGREGGFGLMMAVNHGHGIVTRYAHLSSSKAKVGDKVKRGQVIAAVGNTGRSTGPHLHYEVLLSGVPTNPLYYILD